MADDERASGLIAQVLSYIDKPWKVVAWFAFVGFLTAIPSLARLLFAAVGTLAFIVCPASIIALRQNLELGWKFFAYAVRLNTALYAAYGRLLVYLSTKV